MIIDEVVDRLVTTPLSFPPILLSSLLAVILFRRAQIDAIHLQLFIALQQATQQPITLQLVRAVLRGEYLDPLFQDVTFTFDAVAQSEHLPRRRPTRLKPPPHQRAAIIAMLVKEAITKLPSVTTDAERVKLEKEVKQTHWRKVSSVLQHRLILYVQR